MERQPQAFRFSLFDTVEDNNPLIGNVHYNNFANSASPVGHGCKQEPTKLWAPAVSYPLPVRDTFDKARRRREMRPL